MLWPRVAVDRHAQRPETQDAELVTAVGLAHPGLVEVEPASLSIHPESRRRPGRVIVGVHVAVVPLAVARRDLVVVEGLAVRLPAGVVVGPRWKVVLHPALGGRPMSGGMVGCKPQLKQSALKVKVGDCPPWGMVGVALRAAVYWRGR